VGGASLVEALTASGPYHCHTIAIFLTLAMEGASIFALGCSNAKEEARESDNVWIVCVLGSTCELVGSSYTASSLKL